MIAMPDQFLVALRTYVRPLILAGHDRLDRYRGVYPNAPISALSIAKL
jgi:hypothetical protein